MANDFDMSHRSETSKPKRTSKPLKTSTHRIPPSESLKVEASSDDEDGSKIANVWCMALASVAQLIVALFSIALAIYGNNNMDPSLASFTIYFAILQWEPLIFNIFGLCTLNNCYIVFLGLNSTYFAIFELCTALYITIVDAKESCQQWGCTPFKGEITHRILFIITILLAGAIHVLLTLSFFAISCVSRKRSYTTEVKAPLREPPRRELPSRSCSQSSKKHHHVVETEVSKSSTTTWQSLPTQVETATSFTLPATTAESFTSRSSVSTCPYSAAIVAHSQRRPRYPVYAESQSSLPVSTADTFTITFPTDSGCESISIRVPPLTHQLYLPTPMSTTSATSRATTGGLSTNTSHLLTRTHPSSVQSVAPRESVTSSLYPTGSNFSEYSEDGSLILPDSYNSQHSVQGAQGIFCANVPKNAKKKF